MADAKHPIGEIFVQLGFVTPDEVEAALDFQRGTGSLLGEILVAQGKISRENLASALAEHWDSQLSANSPTAMATRSTNEALSSETGAEAFLRAVGTMTALLVSHITQVADELRGDIAALDARVAAIENTVRSISDHSATPFHL